MALPQRILFLYAATLMIRSILLVLFSLVGLTGIAQTAQSIFEYLSSVLIPQKKHRPFSTVRTDDVYGSTMSF